MSEDIKPQYTAEEIEAKVIELRNRSVNLSLELLRMSEEAEESGIALTEEQSKRQKKITAQRNQVHKEYKFLSSILKDMTKGNPLNVADQLGAILNELKNKTPHPSALAEIKQSIN